MDKKLIIFDLDGTLVDLKEVHYEALNKGIREYTNNNNKYTISKEEHLSKYDGLNTNAKLNLLSTEKNLPRSYHPFIFDLKQKYTHDELQNLKFNYNIWECLFSLKKEYILCVASNSVRNTVRDALYYTRLTTEIEFFISNEDVKYPKPNAEMYLQCMIKAGVSPKETLIIEDSYNGRLGAEQTGALVMGVNSPKDITLENIKQFMNLHEGKNITKWKDPKLNILIPMAGAGSRFSDAGYIFPKPLIEVHGKPMIQVVVENLNIDANYIFLVQKEHYDKYNLKTLLNLITPNCKIVLVDKLTEGAACTTLLAKEHINNDAPLLIANSDQFLEWNSGAFMYSMMGDQIDGGIVTFKATHPKWSFAQINNLDLITRVAEKDPISDNATVGVYFWKQGSDYVKYAEQMIAKNIRTNNEFYVCPVTNEAIQDNKKIKNYHIDKMYGIGTPLDLEYFTKNYNEKI